MSSKNFRNVGEYANVKRTLLDPHGNKFALCILHFN